MEVGVRELKSRLSAYLARARRGEELVVTSRGRAIARLGPPQRRSHPKWLRAGAAEGWITPPAVGGRGGDLLDELAGLGPKPPAALTELHLAERDSEYGDPE